MPTLTAPRRLLASPVVDLLLGPHGVDRYLELIRPSLTVRDARAEVIAVRPGDVLHLGPAQGEFVLPEPRPETLLLVSGGSGITAVLAILRSLCALGHTGEIVFLHYARTAADWLYRAEVETLAARHANLRVHYVATREGGSHIDEATLRGLLPAPGLDRAYGAVCGPSTLLEATREIFSRLPGGAERLLAETFEPLRLPVSAEIGSGTLHFLRSGASAPAAGGTLLEQAEAAGLTPEFGCRMGICHTCTCRKAAGAVRNVLSGNVSHEEDEDIQLCVSVPAGDVALRDLRGENHGYNHLPRNESRAGRIP